MAQMTACVQRRSRPSAGGLAGELRVVGVDLLPRFAAAPLYRRWHQRWGATDAEVHAPMAGEDLIDDVAYLATRAITIDAPPSAVGPWPAQIGYLRVQAVAKASTPPARRPRRGCRRGRTLPQVFTLPATDEAAMAVRPS